VLFNARRVGDRRSGGGVKMRPEPSPAEKPPIHRGVQALTHKGNFIRAADFWAARMRRLLETGPPT
jgi:hypothetical protein